MHVRGWKTRITQLVLAAAVLLIVSVAVPGITKDPRSGWPGPSSTGPSKTYSGSGPSPTIVAQNSGSEDFTEVSINNAPVDVFDYEWRLGDIAATSDDVEIDDSKNGESVVDHELPSLDQHAVGSVQIEVGHHTEHYPESDADVTFDDTNQDPTDDSTPTSFTVDAAEIGAATRID